MQTWTGGRTSSPRPGVVHSAYLRSEIGEGPFCVVVRKPEDLAGQGVGKAAATLVVIFSFTALWLHISDCLVLLKLSF